MRKNNSKIDDLSDARHSTTPVPVNRSECDFVPKIADRSVGRSVPRKKRYDHGVIGDYSLAISCSASLRKRISSAFLGAFFSIHATALSNHFLDLFS